jgi:hypothetical protein
LSTEYRKKVESLGLHGAPDVVPFRDAVYKIDALDAEKVRDGAVVLTTAKAVEYIELRVFPGEREVSDTHVQTLVDEMNRGRFNWDVVILARAELRGVVYKINGQHTSWARLALPDEPSPSVREVVYRVGSDEQLKALYATFDRAKPRSDTHLTRLELLGTAATDGLSARTITKVTPGFKAWKYPNREDYRRVGPAEVAAIVNAQYPKLFNTVGKFFAGVDVAAAPLADRSPVLAALFETFDRFPSLAPEFWRDCLEGTNLVKTDARWHLRKYLEASSLSRKGSNTDKKIVTNEEMYLTCLAAWNRWRKNEEVRALKPLEKRSRAI